MSTTSKANQLLELATQDLIALLVNNKKLYDQSTGLYLEGSKYLYGILDSEIENGKLIQQEV